MGKAMTQVNRHLMPTLALGVTCCALAIAACGSSGKPSDQASTASKQGLQFANCMRAHGVPNFPDPSAGGGLKFQSDGGINPQSPAFQSAQKACGSLAPGGGGPPSMSESQRLAAIRFAKCMRTHGQPNFPDPTLTAPTGPPVLALRGMVFALGPGINPRSQAFRQAAAKCGVGLP